MEGPREFLFFRCAKPCLGYASKWAIFFWYIVPLQFAYIRVQWCEPGRNFTVSFLLSTELFRVLILAKKVISFFVLVSSCDGIHVTLPSPSFLLSYALWENKAHIFMPGDHFYLYALWCCVGCYYAIKTYPLPRITGTICKRFSFFGCFTKIFVANGYIARIW